MMADPVPRALCKLIDERDHYACVKCGKPLHVTSGSRHHRQRRAIGGHTPENLILLCGSGTTGCHGDVHDHPEDARKHGWIVRATGIIEPEEIPLQVVANGPGSALRWVMLSAEGTMLRISDMTALALIGPNL
jgi:hypothetical protein